MAGAGEGLDKRLEEHLAAGRFYEAHQLLRARYNRLALQKRHAEVAPLLVAGMRALLAHGQAASATDLGLCLAEHYRTVGHALDGDTAALLRGLLDAFPSGPDPGKRKFVGALTKWAGEHDPTLCRLVGTHYSQQGAHAAAYAYLLHASQPEELGKLLVAWASQGYPSEADLFLARTVLGLLTFQKLAEANTLYAHVTANHKTLPQTPLVNFLRFLLLTLERDAAPLFRDLRTRYAASLSRDPEFEKMLDTIGRLYFNIQPSGGAGGGLGGLLSGFMRSMMPPAAPPAAAPQPPSASSFSVD